MTIDRCLILFYALFWVIRINGCIRRGRQPLLRGREWFFSVPVQPGFYDGEGKTILHRYWMRMLIPFAVDIPLAAWIFIVHRYTLLNLLIVALCALIHVNHLISVDIAERQARRYAIEEAQRPVSRLMLSLTPRRLRDYTNATLEWAMAIATFATAAWLVRRYTTTTIPYDLRRVWVLGAFFLYTHAGLLLVKQLIVSWRSPVPQDDAAEHLEVREAVRRFYLWMCDWSRVSLTMAGLFWPLSMSVSAPAASRLLSVWLIGCLGFSVALTIWGERRRKQLRSLTSRVRPAKFPDFVHQSDVARWPVCYEPSIPMLILRGASGYSLNMANALPYVGAAYIAGLIALFALLPFKH